MTKLSEIEAAIEGLPQADKQRLLLFLAARLRSEGGPVPAPRRFSADRVEGWVAEDEADMRRLRESNGR